MDKVIALDLSRGLILSDGISTYQLEIARVEKLTGWRPTPQPTPRTVTLYSQRDPRWAGEVYAGGLTFATDGCYTTCYAMIASLAGYTDTPPQAAAKLRAAGCYDGAELAYPEKGLAIYRTVTWSGRKDWPDLLTDDELAWLVAEIDRGPTILEIDFKPATSKLDRHFVVALRMAESREDIWIADPWDGAEKLLLPAYGKPGWALARAVWGVRLLRAGRS